MTSYSNSSDEESGPLPRVKKRACFTDSDSDKEYAQQNNKRSDSDDDPSIKKSSPAKENTLKDDSDSESENKTIKNEEKEHRIKMKRNKLRDKFKSLITSRSKEASKKDTDSDIESNQNNHSEESNDEESSINNIKQGIKKSMLFKPSICDPDTSDEEDINDKREQILSKSLNQKKSTKATTQKPLRMSAKQAMDNMQKIKSESNRLLREKEVTLPYHRPKAFSLKDIIRRKQAVTADGKALPIKMNEEQLKQYAQMLEQRQKEIMELCKSDSDEEQCNSKEIKEPSTNANIESECLDNNENQAANVLADDFICTGETSPREDTQKSNEINNLIHLSSDNTPELEISSNTVVQKERFIEDDKNKCTLNTENVKIGSLNIPKDPKNDLNEEIVTPNIMSETMDISEKSAEEQTAKISTDSESQMLNLHYDSENIIADKLQINHNSTNENKTCESDIFSDGDIDMDDIDKMIENAEIINDVSSDHNIKPSTQTATAAQLFVKPKIMGAPGMVIDLDDNDSASSKKLSGVELLKERFTYFAKLKTPEELEREKKSKPGAQHLKLKHDLEEIISEQRSLEWAKRLNEEKQHQMELKTLRGEESDAEDDIDKIEAQIEENNFEHEETSEGESEPEEEDLGEIKEKVRSKNLMIDDEAEESNCDDEDGNEVDLQNDGNDENEELDDDIDVSCEEQSSEESGDDQLEEETTKRRKGRILKAFEDSDDENEPQKPTDSIEVSAAEIFEENESNIVKDKVTLNNSEAKETIVNNEKEVDNDLGSQIFIDSQDDEIQLAQRMVSVSDDMFTSQESTTILPREISQGDNETNVLGTQTFSILDSTCIAKNVLSNLQSTQKLSLMSGTQATDDNLGVAVHLCSENFTQNLIPSHLSSSQQLLEPSQAIGEDVLALCTGNFYDNQFISQSEENNKNGTQDAGNDHFDDSWSKSESQEDETNIIISSNDTNKDPKENNQVKDNDKLTDRDESKGKVAVDKAADENLLQSIIDELHDEGKENSVNSNKYFVSKNTDSEANNQVKKKFVFESDDELNEDTNKQKKRKKIKKKKLEQRALQISDDEQEESEEEYVSELENDPERIVDYDSEENEIEVKQLTPKKKRKVADFFENEAELTSEDEWVGSGDEDEADLDRMEREEGDDETFHQGKLQRELGQIHMRDVLDQDKREVRIIQELLFEDGDLGDGHRQRKFRWRNADDGEESGAVIDEFTDTQEEEFESEEQWRKQRHEREIFLRQMKEQDKSEDTPNITINRSTIIKANLSSKTMSTLLLEVNNTTAKTDKIQNSTVKENSIKDIPSPKKGFTILQQNYHNSLLTRGRGALARLAALATPLAIDEDSTNVATVAPKNQRNFVFSAVAKEDSEPKVMKRKADSKLDTPRLVKKLRTNDKQTLSRNSLLDHLKI